MNFIIYSDAKSTRLAYIISFLMEEFLSVPYEWTTHKAFYQNSDHLKINYSRNSIAKSEFRIAPTAILYELDVVQQNTDVFQVDQEVAFFKTDESADLNFDLWGMIFYLITRYEEYLPFHPDTNGRFPATESMALRNDFLHLPLVDVWVFEWIRLLNEKFQINLRPAGKYQFLPTYDIDYVWAFRYKSWYRLLGATVRDIMEGQRSSLEARVKSWTDDTVDPFYVFPYIDQIHEKYDIDPIFFFLLADPSSFDKNNTWDHPKVTQFISKMQSKYSIGIHPSYDAVVDFEILKKEIGRLENITQKSVGKSRQHFLRLQLPTTYRLLIQAGISNDYTMGYADDVGFRASTGRSFYWFDLEKNEATDLRIHPFQVMDMTLMKYLQLTPDEAIEKISHLIQVTKKYQGTFCSLWHNSSFSGEWKEWRVVFEKMMEMGVGE